MYKTAGKPKENPSRAAANSVAQKKQNESQGFGLLDHREASNAQKIVQLEMRGHRIDGQQGTFIGAANATHIHIIGSNTHLIVRGNRYNFDENSPDGRMQNAYRELRAQGQGTPGYEECLAAFERELGTQQIDSTTKKPDNDGDHGDKDDKYRYNRWQDGKDRLRTDRYGIPINKE